MPEIEPKTGHPAPKRPYLAPELVLFGNVEEFTRGSGSSTNRDADRTSRKVR
jgi:hypothetical protein